MDNNMDKFESLDTTGAVGGVAPAVVGSKEDEKKARRKAKMMQMEAALNERLQKDPDYFANKNTLSACLKVTRVCAYTNSGNIIADKSQPKNEKGQYPRIEVSKNVGYEIENIGTKPIQYPTEVFAKNAEGVYVGTNKVATLAPKAKAIISKKNLVVMLSKVEYSFQISNGVILASSAVGGKTVDEILDRYYFSFNDGTIVNSDAIKLQIGKKGAKGADGKETWSVLPEYCEVFGYLNNPKPEREKKAATKKSGKSLYDMSANYINMLVEKGEI